MEPDRQLEIQLGHMCNNRCVFCVSGQRTEMHEALPISGDPVIERLREARSAGIEKVTLLGGEPTIQPDFLRIVRAAVELKFAEIVIFTNGVKTARGSFLDELLSTGGNFTFRLSFQGATGRAHDRTTKKLGSFQRLVETMRNLRERGQRITVNMCVVRSNYESVGEFPALLVPFGVQQLHLDMIRPLDAGVRSEDEMRAMLPRYSDMVPHLERMVAGFPPGFDVNIGNLPYCIAPSLAPFIHHDGESTLTVAVDHRDDLSEPWDKYQVKRRDKLKVAGCRECVFDDRCSGIFDTYQRFHGTEELVPITRKRLPLVDPQLRMFTLHAEPLVATLRSVSPRAPFGPAPEVHVDSRAERVVARFARVDGGFCDLELRRPDEADARALSSDTFSLRVTAASVLDDAVRVLARDLFAELAKDTLTSPLDWRIGRCLERVRNGLPYRALQWEGVALGRDGREATIALRHDGGTGVALFVALDGDRVRSGYRLDREVREPPASLVDGVRAAMSALRGSG